MKGSPGCAEPEQPCGRGHTAAEPLTSLLAPHSGPLHLHRCFIVSLRNGSGIVDGPEHRHQNMVRPMAGSCCVDGIKTQ